MEAVLEDLESSVELLSVSQTELVTEWDRETVDRALQWARHCEHLHSRFHTDPSVRAAMENRLHETNQLLAHTFTGHQGVSLPELSQCRLRLLTGLLKNPETPHTLIKSLLDGFRLAEDAENDLGDLGACRSACELLGVFRVKKSDSPGLSAGTQAQAIMLLQHLQAMLRHPENLDYSTKLLDCVLEDSGEGRDSLGALIAAALLSSDTMSENTAAQDFLLHWLEGHDGLLHSMCQSLSPELCTRLSQQWTKFRLAYWDSLKRSASLLEYDVSNGLWTQPHDSSVSFLTLTDRIKSLWSSGSPLKEETEKHLVALKQADGDFEVRGLSVWTDLLVQLK